MSELVGLWWVLLPSALFVVSFALEPRKFRTGVWFFTAIAWLVALAIAAVIDLVTTQWDELAGAYVLLGVIGLLALTVVVLAVFLIISGITLVGREGFRPGRLLAIALGLLMLGYLAAGLGVVAHNSAIGLVWFLLLAPPIAYFGFGFVAFVSYGLFYPAWMERFGPLANVVVVLGSGLLDGQVPPLLASRLRKGRAVRQRSLAAGGDAVLITSGGRGEDEPVAEADAMREFLIEEGVPAASVLVEDRSRNTEQNLVFTTELIAEHDLRGPVAVVTNDFHALRAALLMRKAGMPGYSVGAPTARYYWPTAVIREYVAVIRDHLRLNALLVAISLMPLATMWIVAVFGPRG